MRESARCGASLLMETIVAKESSGSLAGQRMNRLDNGLTHIPFGKEDNRRIFM